MPLVVKLPEILVHIPSNEIPIGCVDGMKMLL
jgi:hypothetical protein